MKLMVTARTLVGSLTFYWRYDMNERIRQLAEQLDPVATIGNWGRVEWADNVYPQLDDKMYAAIDLEKFAELIVQECIDALWTEECHVSDLAVEDYNRKSKKIKEHFGIGEVE